MRESDWDPGKLRGIQRVTTDDGFLHICAIDHQRVLKSMIGGDPEAVGFGDVVALKDGVVRSVAPEVSGVLTDARYGAAFLIVSGALDRNLGHVVEVGDESYDIPPGLRRTRLRSKWSMEKVKAIGGDVAKLLWFFRPDADAETADHQRQVLTDLVAEGNRLSLPLVVEPIWYPLVGEDPKTEAWRRRRADGIVESAIEADRLGSDLLKVEFPGYLDTPAGVAAAEASCKDLDAGVGAPWVLLSAGVDFTGFTQQVEIASKAGAAGYMAGRSVWQDVVGVTDADQLAVRRAETIERLQTLNTITRRHGTPISTSRPLDEVLGQLPEFWYESWHEPAATRG